MAKITDPDNLNVGVEISIDTTLKTFTLNAAGNLTASAGATIQAVYSKFVDLWLTDTYNKFQFPMYTIDALSGQYQFGTDGSTYSGWKPADTPTRQRMRDGGWSEYLSDGTLDKQFAGIVSLGDVNETAQLYYQNSSSAAAVNFTFTSSVNEGIQVYSASTYDNRTFFKGYVREYGKKYDDSILADTGKTATGAYIVNLLLSNEDDLKIQAVDNIVTGSAPYTTISASYLSGTGFAVATAKAYVENEVGQDTAGRWFRCSVAGTLNAAGVLDYTNNGGTGTFVAYLGERAIGGTYYAFNKIISGSGAVAEDIYTKIQYQLRQNSDINQGGNGIPVIGKTADLLLNFVGDTLYTTTGVYIDNYDADDINRLVFTDVNGVERTEPFTATGTFSFNSPLVSASAGYYVMYFTDLSGSSDYGNANAIMVRDSSNAIISGSITSPSASFTFAYDTNNQGGRTTGSDAGVTIVAGCAGSAKPVVTTATITRTTGQAISLVAETDRAYLY